VKPNERLRWAARGAWIGLGAGLLGAFLTYGFASSWLAVLMGYVFSVAYFSLMGLFFGQAVSLIVADEEPGEENTERGKAVALAGILLIGYSVFLPIVVFLV
jgi:hypothetical protein